MIAHIVDLMRSGLHVAIVTAAGACLATSPAAARLHLLGHRSVSQHA